MRPAAHLLALWALAVAQPVYDVLRRNGEFFIAHRAQPLDLMLFAAAASFALPLALVLPWLVTRAMNARLGRAVLVISVSVLVTMLASQVMAHRLALSVPVHVAVAGGLGALGGWLYATRPAAQLFLTVLFPSAIIVPALFLLHPSMSLFVRPGGRDLDAAARIDRHVPPIVFVVFDQLPLVSLMDARGNINRERYPGFAALADDATWFRGATTVAEFTGWALPPIVSGMRSNAQRVPTTRSYPHNLFTWLGGRYRLEVQEPITQLCPERLCDSRRAPLPVRLASMLLDSSVVYLNIALPAGLRTHLPPLTENWKDFIHDQRWQRRWVAQSRDDRRQVPRDLIASISRDDPQPTLYFAHALLPHEPYVYLRSGQEVAADPQMPGIGRTGRWVTDEWPVTEAYMRHLLQLEYVDTLVLQLLEKLKAEGLYEQSMIVVTADHGVSFRPGGQFKGLEAANAAEIMSVPLLVKMPGQRQPVIDDSNVESVDLMPTLASRLGVPLTWDPDGHVAGTAKPEPAGKRIRHGGARIETTFDAGVLMKARDAAVARKVALFGDGPGWRPAAVERRELIGQRVDALPSVEGPWQVVVNGPEDLDSVNRSGSRLPVRLTGWVRDGRGDPTEAVLAVAVNGTIAAVTRTYQPEYAARGSWSTLVDPGLLVDGRNEVTVFVIAPGTGQLHLAYASHARPTHLDLSSRGAEEFWGVRQSGFHPREGTAIPHRWTSGEGVIVVPLDAGRRPKSLRVGLAALPPGGTPLTVTIDNCTVFSGDVSETPWYRTFSLGDCPAGSVAGSEARITIASRPWTSEAGRSQGVAVAAVNLLDSGWPLVEDQHLEMRGELRPIDQPAGGTWIAGEPIRVELVNTGKATWLPQANAPEGARWVQIALRWQREGSRQTFDQRLPLPHAVYPADRMAIDLPLVPPAELRDTPPWTVAIVPVLHDGKPVPLESPLTLKVSDARPSRP